MKTTRDIGQVNRIIANALLVCTVFMVMLLLLCKLSIFNFNSSIRAVIIVVGFFTTVTPRVLLECGVNDNFLKYYMMCMMTILICALGTFNGIGIYITYALVPVVSGIYFDRKLTLRFGILGYLAMVISVYINSANKMEVLFYNWTHAVTFRNYMIGFTIEYLVVMIFVYLNVSRAQETIERQDEYIAFTKKDKAKYESLLTNSADLVIMYDIETDTYRSTHSLFTKPEDRPDEKPVVYEEFSHYAKMQKRDMNLIYDIITQVISKGGKVEDELEFTHENSVGQEEKLIYHAEVFPLYNEEKEITEIIGMLHNITRTKMAKRNLDQERISNIYLETMGEGRRSVYQNLMAEGPVLSEEDYLYLSDAHQLMAQITEVIKYSTDVDTSMQNIFEIIGEYFALDRIGVLRTNVEEKTNQLIYQWNSPKCDPLTELLPEMSQEDIDRSEKAFDLNGLLEFNFEKGKVIENFDEKRYREILKVAYLGNQMWIPTLSEGRYNGTFFFDRYDTTLYSPVEKFVLSELVTTLSAYVNKAYAEQANKEKSMFLSNMSHEIRTPMNVIEGMAEVALRDDLNPDTRRYLQGIKSASSGLLFIINDILDFSKIEAGKMAIVPEKYDTLAILNDVISVAHNRNKEKGLKLEFDIPKNLPSKLEGDMVRIKQILINVINNAIKYTDSGTVRLQVSCDRISDTECNIAYTVKDSGQGMTEEELKHLFESFTRFNNQKNHHVEGTGLGMAIAHQLAELMDGELSVESTYGEGSTFTLRLPQVIIDNEPAGDIKDFTYHDEVTKEVSFTAPDAKVLLVDDNKVNRMVALALFKPLNMQFDQAGDGIEALEKIKNNTYDLILMDHFMPTMDGEETTRKIRETIGNSNQNVPIIALTADAVSGVREKLLACGMNDFISKPIDFSLAAGRMKRWLPKEKVCEE
ncbi:MAG: response regulator [Lachnospiraceae bacterium]|nr:response regulator [Lachnospiraceae bacterium]